MLARYSRPSDAFYGAFGGVEAQWSRTDQLLAGLVDAVNDLTWMYGCAHSENPPDRPPRVERPGVSAHRNDGSKHYGFDPIPAADFDAWWEGGGG